MVGEGMSYIKLDRKMLSWEWKDNPNMVALWIEILLQANWEDRNWHGETFEAGSFPTSLNTLSKSTGLSVQSIRTCLKNLEKSQEITQISTKAGTKIIVNKWAEFQCSEDEANTDDNTELTKSQQRPNKELTTLKEIKEIEEIKNTRKEIYKEKKSEAVKIEGSQELTEAFEALIEVRKAKKVPNTERAVRQIISKLEKLAPNDEAKKIELLNTAVERGWSTVFETITPQKKGDVWFE